MNEIKVFENPEFGKVRTIEIDGEPWFVGKDVAGILGYQDTFGALKKHVDDEDKQNCQNDSFESKRGLMVINESGLYSLILSSKLPTAKKFKRWVTSEVLPSIRKTGSYSTDNSMPKMSPMEMIASLANNAVKVEKTLAEHGKRIDDLETKSDINIQGVVYEALTYGTLSYEQQKYIQAKISLRVYQLLPDYEDYRKNRDKLTNTIYSAVRRKFSVSSFRNIRVRDFSKAIIFIENFELS